MLAAIIVAAALTTAAAEQARPASSDYDLAAETILHGKVRLVHSHFHADPPATHLIVRQANGKDVEVHLAPPAYIKRMGFAFAIGDEVEIVAAKARGEEHYHARSVRKGGRTLLLRDAQGKPLWGRPPSE